MNFTKRKVVTSLIITFLLFMSSGTFAVETVKTGISRLSVWPGGHIIVDLQDSAANFAFSASTCGRQDAGQVPPSRVNYDQLYSTLHAAFALGKMVKVNFDETRCFGDMVEIHTVHIYNN